MQFKYFVFYFEVRAAMLESNHPYVYIIYSHCKLQLNYPNYTRKLYTKLALSGLECILP